MPHETWTSNDSLEATPARDRKTILRAACHWHGLHLPIIPLVGKRPAFKGWQQYVPSPATIDQDFAGRNIGLKTGEYVVIETDTSEAEAFLARAQVDSPMKALSGSGRSIHYYFRAPKGVVIGNRLNLRRIPGLDVRGRGGLIVFPPSIHPASGKPYRFLTEFIPLPGLPPFPVHLLEESVRPRMIPVTGSATDLAERARRYITHIVSIAGQQGDLQAFRCACALIQKFRLEYLTALDLMREWNQTHAQPPWPDARLRYKLAQALQGQK